MKSDVIAHLKEMLDLSDEEISEYLEAFFESLNDCCNQLMEQRDNVDFSTIRIITHTMAGFTENMGAMDILAKVRDLNTAAKALNAEQCRKEIDNIIAMKDLYQN